jgi:hypothetical protein
MKKQTFLFLAILLPILAFSQSSSYQFPDDWMGTYQGKMYVFFPNNTVDTVDLTFTLAPTEEENSWRYVMSYESEKYGNTVKDYRLIQPDTLPPNTYLTDERNGIYIEEVLLDNTFYSSFSVGNSRLFGMLRKRGDHIEWEITTTRNESTLASGTEPDEEGKVFLVDSHIPFTTQKAVLYKKK